MADFYEQMQGIASDLLKRFDQKRPGDADPASNGIFYVDIVPGGGPAQNPGPSQEVPYKVNGVVRGVKFRFIDNKNVLASDLQVTFDVNPAFAPNGKGFVIVDGTRHKVVQVIRRPAAGTPVAYTVIFGNAKR